MDTYLHTLVLKKKELVMIKRL